MAISERGGIASFYVDGALYEISAQITVKLGGVTRTAKVASDGSVVGFITKGVAPEVGFDAIDGGQVSVAALKAIQGQTVQVVMRNGKSYLLTQAFQIDDPEIKPSDGDIGGVKLSGALCTEVLAP